MSAGINVSSVPLVRAKLEELFTDALKGRALDSGDVTVIQGELKDSERESVQIGSAKGRQAPLTQGGPTGGYRAETYDVNVLICAYRQAATQVEASERAFELFGILDSVVRAKPELDLVGDTLFQQIDAGVGDFEDTLIPGERGYQAEISWFVEITAVI